MLVAFSSVLLGLTFVLAGAAKLIAGRSWVTEAQVLGAPRAAAHAVPWIELAVGAALVTQLARRPAAATAIVLLVVFTALIVTHLRADRHPRCACFGAWSSKPLGTGHVVRNVVLIALGVIALA